MSVTPKRLAKIERVLGHRQGQAAVVLENVHDPHNIAAVMRSCDAVGVQHVYVLNTSVPCYSTFGKRSSASANKWVTVHAFTDLHACVQALRSTYGQIVCSYVHPTAQALYDVNLCESVALVFGNEHSGVSEGLRQMADGLFVIPQCGMVQSLNVSVACAVSVYEMFRQRTKQGASVPLPAGEQMALRQKWIRNEKW